MHEFESIRPYRDEEVPGVVARLVRDPKLTGALARFTMPRLARVMPGLAGWLASRLLARRVRSLRTVDDLQQLIEPYFTKLIRETITELTVSGLDGLPTDQGYLFISNHRDILMDTGLLNYVIHEAGHQTTEAAVGDNLLSDPFAADLMRLNKSFMVERSVTGKRAVYRALSLTSHYIRDALESGRSVWIAQREGRSKDGFDRTEPALLKMLALAWRKDITTFGALLSRLKLVPVSISYELDPCDREKAHELAVIHAEGEYHKASDEDLTSIVTGMTGFKGRVHFHFTAPLEGDFEDADALAVALDRAIVGGLRVFPSQAEAARQLGFERIPDAGPWLEDVKSRFELRFEECPEAELPFLLAGYGNLIRNRAELGL